VRRARACLLCAGIALARSGHSVALAQAVAQTVAPAAPGGLPTVPAGLVAARQALAAKDYARARALFLAYGREHPGSPEHPGNVEAELGVGDVDLAERHYEAAELEYRRVVAQQPELWLAHKNLVIVEAALGRWEEFDRERALLRDARRRGAPGIDARESDIVDAFDATTKVGVREHWIVRAYDEPVGRSLTRYNFERFAPDGRVQEYISLESAEAAQRALERSKATNEAPTGIRIGADAAPASIDDFALNFYTGKAHGTIARYPGGEPSYERVRADVLRWLRR